MSIRKGLARAVAVVRKRRDLAQEDFSDVSSRTYVSSIERAIKSPTIEKLEQLAKVMDVNIATLVVLAMTFAEGESIEEVLDRIRSELNELVQSDPMP